MSEPKSSGAGKWVKLIIVLAVVGSLFGASRVLPITQWFTNLLAWVDGLGPVGPIVLCVIYVFATVLFLPGSILTLGAGVLFGVVVGSITVSIASTLGATAAFLVGRFIARDAIAKKIEGNTKFKAIDEAVGKEGWKIVGLTRLSPIFPFNLLNYAFGLTNVSLKEYVIASWIGMMPGTVMYVYIGSLIGDLASLGAERTQTTGELVLKIVGLVITVVVTLFVTRIAKRALDNAIADTDAQPAEESIA
jgi:uncharacterized membrane protein YdjX (TVP38/TMEM64 family)